MSKKIEAEKQAVEFAFKVLLLDLPEEKQKQFNGKLAALLAEVEKAIPSVKGTTVSKVDLKMVSTFTPPPQKESKFPVRKEYEVVKKIQPPKK